MWLSKSHQLYWIRKNIFHNIYFSWILKLSYLVRQFPFQAQQKLTQPLYLTENWLYDEEAYQDSTLAELSVSGKSLFITTNTSVYALFSIRCASLKTCTVNLSHRLSPKNLFWALRVIWAAMVS